MDPPDLVLCLLASISSAIPPLPVAHDEPIPHTISWLARAISRGMLSDGKYVPDPVSTYLAIRVPCSKLPEAERPFALRSLLDSFARIFSVDVKDPHQHRHHPEVTTLPSLVDSLASALTLCDLNDQNAQQSNDHLTLTNMPETSAVWREIEGVCSVWFDRWSAFDVSSINYIKQSSDLSFLGTALFLSIGTLVRDSPPSGMAKISALRALGHTEVWREDTSEARAVLMSLLEGDVADSPKLQEGILSALSDFHQSYRRAPSSPHAATCHLARLHLLLGAVALPQIARNDKFWLLCWPVMQDSLASFSVSSTKNFMDPEEVEGVVARAYNVVAVALQSQAGLDYVGPFCQAALLGLVTTPIANSDVLTAAAAQAFAAVADNVSLEDQEWLLGTISGCMLRVIELKGKKTRVELFGQHVNVAHRDVVLERLFEVLMNAASKCEPEISQQMPDLCHLDVILSNSPPNAEDPSIFKTKFVEYLTRAFPWDSRVELGYWFLKFEDPSFGKKSGDGGGNNETCAPADAPRSTGPTPVLHMSKL